MKTQNALEQINYLQDLISQTRSRAVEGYPHLLVWGALWVVGYLSTIWLSHVVWPIIGAVGGVLSMVIAGIDLKKAFRADKGKK